MTISKWVNSRDKKCVIPYLTNHSWPPLVIQCYWSTCVCVLQRYTWICIAPCREHTSKALRYGTRSQGISQFYLHTSRLSANGMYHTCLCLRGRSWYSFSDPRGMEGWVGLGLYEVLKAILSFSLSDRNLASISTTSRLWYAQVWNGSKISE